MSPSVQPIFHKYRTLYEQLSTIKGEYSLIYLDSLHTALRTIVAEASRTLSFNELLQFKEACELIDECRFQ